MAEWRLFPEGTVPEHTTVEWYADREAAPHVDQEMHRPRLELAAQYAVRARSYNNAQTLSDLGAGDGGFLTLVKDEFIECWGYDLQPLNVEAAGWRGVKVELLDVIQGEPRWGEVVVCTEMLEHLLDPHAFVRRIAENSDVLVASSPWNESEGSAYGYHTWAWDHAGYVALMEQAGFQVVSQGSTGMFQVVLAVR